MNQIILYGLGNAEQQYIVQRYYIIYEDEASIRNIMYRASMLKAATPGIESVYAIDNRRGLYREYLDSIKIHSVESCAIFKDTLEREGIRVA